MERTLRSLRPPGSLRQRPQGRVSIAGALG